MLTHSPTVAWPCVDNKRMAVLLLTVALVFACTSDSLGEGGKLSPEQILAEAPARIERHRMAEAEIVVEDGAGKPLAGVEIQIEQKRHQFLFGCNIFLWGRIEDSEIQARYLERFAALLNYATLPFYWPMYEPVRGKPNHQYAEQVARWCKEHGILTKGHPLAWNYADPRWLPENSEEVLQLLLARIEDCVSRFRGLIDRWDVVNEATHYDRLEMWRRAPRITGTWQKVGQVEFVKACFRQARKANKDAVLIINDYRIDPAYEKLIEQLVDENGRPLYDVIGIQSHMHGGVWSTEQIWDVCERFSRFGVPLHFTETTILSGARERPAGKPWLTTKEGEEWQAREVERFYTVLFSHPAVEAITWWDFSDFRAWQAAPAGLVRADMSPKPAYEVLYQLIKGKWWTVKTLKTDDAGRGRFRGFLGDYQVKVTLPDGRELVRAFTLVKAGDNIWRIKPE
ncbi:MAG: endo-1,4-beta-xylanase [Thermoguttaceae bacterium]|nr:endo-1,4-beta-xylanase [Thermoguttaceae bacterium]MDW8078365.1 endo-1,4-beta-xylanase [Thermoguttaceae bacterium]